MCIPRRKGTAAGRSGRSCVFSACFSGEISIVPTHLSTVFCLNPKKNIRHKPPRTTPNNQETGWVKTRTEQGIAWMHKEMLRKYQGYTMKFAQW
jgi:hypothetical protein